jgi:hypothetical protein
MTCSTSPCTSTPSIEVGNTWSKTFTLVNAATGAPIDPVPVYGGSMSPSGVYVAIVPVKLASGSYTVSAPMNAVGLWVLWISDVAGSTPTLTSTIYQDARVTVRPSFVST